MRAGFPLEAEVERLRPGATLAIPASVLGELDRLLDRETPDAASARALASRFLAVATIGRGDAAVRWAALRHDAWVVTGDRELRERLRRDGIPVLYPRDRHRLECFAAEKMPVPARRGRRARHG